jgi:hypothetical protein
MGKPSRKRLLNSGLFLSLLILTNACAPGLPVAALLTGSSASNQLGCSTFRGAFYDALYSQVVHEKLSSRKDFEQATRIAVEKNKNLDLTQDEKDELNIKLGELYEILTTQSLTGINQKNKTNVLAQLTSLEMGDRSDDLKTEIQKSLTQKINEIDQIARNKNSGCIPSKSGGGGTSPQGYLAALHANLAAPVYGAWKTLATAYQSCEAPFLQPVSSSTPNLKGITTIGQNADGIGYIRKVTNAAEAASTHYYIKNFRAPSSTCFDVAASPLIYNYGGKPNVTSALNSKFDFFTPSPDSGTDALGVDCSGFIFVSYAAAGLKMTRESRLKAIHVTGISSNMLFDPANNGLTCMDAMNFLNPTNIQPGDLIVEHGHVIMIDQLGSDPFGLNRFTSLSQCQPSNINVSQFNFVINQSSPVNGGLGMNRYLASDYFRQNSTMAVGLQHYAASLCQIKFGAAAAFSTSLISIVRHSSDSTCFDQPIALKNEECLSSCPIPQF